MSAATSMQTVHAAPALAHDVMTTQVISVGPDEPVGNIAKLLLQHRVSAVPVVRADGVPIGMVSEGDLIGRPEQDRVARVDWWLALLAGEQPLDDEFRQRLQATGNTAREVMSAPLVTVTEDTHVDAIARLLGMYGIKRVPVLRDNRIVGIVSRADLLHVVAAAGAPGSTPDKTGHSGFLRGLFGEYHRPAWERASSSSANQPGPSDIQRPLAAADLRRLVEDAHSDEINHRDAARRAEADQRRRHAAELINTHVAEHGWRQMLQGARDAAQHGQEEFMLLRFPNQLCLDGGRAINTAEPDWPATLQGEPAELYLRWQQELKQLGFGMTARILEFPGGMPGDVGLFLTWGA